MEKFSGIIDNTSPYLNNVFSFIDYDKEKVLWFDIETTGLQAEVSSLYMIGCGFFCDDSWNYIQWFANDYTSEQQLLECFYNFSNNYDCFITYNGNRFDIPYLKKKYDSYNIPSPFFDKDTIDIYYEIKKIKALFPTTNMKLLTVEKLLGFNRKDTFSGKDCIDLYVSFMHKKFFYDDSCNECKEKLLLHNKEDIIGTILTTILLVYRNKFFNSISTKETNEGFIITNELDFMLPFDIELKNQSDILSFCNNKISLSAKYNNLELKHFFKNYKDYYYLPYEDYAIHKSVANFVSSDNKIKAKKDTCYIKKTGNFINAYTSDCYDEKEPLFKRSQSDSVSYILLSSDKYKLVEQLKYAFYDISISFLF